MTAPTTDGATDASVEKPRFAGRAIVVAAFTALTGPLIGALTLLVVVFGLIIADMRFEDIKVPDFADLSKVVLVVVLYAYLLAGSSAILAGVMLGWRTYTHGMFGYGFTVVVAAIATVVGTVSLDLILGRSDQSFIGMALFFTPLSMVAAGVGRWMLGRFGVLPSSPGSSKA